MPHDDQDFSQHPKSISELRAEKTHSSLDIKPRDILIDMLREIDAGTMAPTKMVISYADSKSGGYRAAGVNFHEAVGLVTITASSIVSSASVPG